MQGRGERKRLGEHLVEAGIIRPDQLQVALVEQKRTGKKLAEMLRELGFISEEQAKNVLGEVTGHSVVDPNAMLVDPELIRLIPESLARQYLVFPISFDKKRLHVAVADPDDIILLDKIKRAIGNDAIEVVPFIANPDAIRQAIEKYYGFDFVIDHILDELTHDTSAVGGVEIDGTYEHPIVRLVDSILSDAVKKGASDIHIEPEEKFARLRYRIDGVLQEIKVFHKSLFSPVTVRIKILSELDISESRHPQDGRMQLNILGREIFFRVSTLPTIHGENIVLRILDRNKGIVPLDKLGLDKHATSELQLVLARPVGIILVTGPTGSGKTTTLYSILNERNSPEINIMTLEDPVEYPSQLIRQTQINEDIGFTFGSGVRALLRQDPDIILIGEVRDQDTAEMAFRAAMTGHQVLATLHTNSAIGAITRLIDLGVTKTVLAGNIAGILAQRLVRRLCNLCKVPYEPDSMERKLLGIPDSQESIVLYAPKGCPACNGTGYSGRIAVVEILRMNKELDDLVLKEASLSDFMEVAKANGFRPLVESAINRVLSGETSLHEIARVIDLSEQIG
ncbi:general secretion pathway protein E/type IV pilus assembly protein PilB [Sulfurivirga caldicuralii]|uniref:General secretion pathway protein E/type IV pilus assembly protein PilB n=1 Tax=Sulfurivirga caldicuralii TaxID=364032 RepID=A0A1N6EJ96_9GAMM|nr:GspE/PulE family protein [Sulfurivirga caldicuralii]SIN83031.1 general secretion pathway protein E/type IV pilus assembly protein PilB [Sulfurivirga caldicuralii]